MRPMERRETGQRDLFRARLDQIVDLDHPLVKLVRAIDWGFLEERCGAVYTDGPGRPPLPTRLTAGLAILRHMHDLSDEVLCERRIGGQFLAHVKALPGNRYDSHTLAAAILTSRERSAPSSAASSPTPTTAATTLPRRSASRSMSPARSAGSALPSSEPCADARPSSHHWTPQERAPHGPQPPHRPARRRRQRRARDGRTTSASCCGGSVSCPCR